MSDFEKGITVSAVDPQLWEQTWENLPERQALARKAPDPKSYESDEYALARLTARLGSSIAGAAALACMKATENQKDQQ